MNPGCFDADAPLLPEPSRERAMAFCIVCELAGSFLAAYPSANVELGFADVDTGKRNDGLHDPSSVCSEAGSPDPEPSPADLVCELQGSRYSAALVTRAGGSSLPQARGFRGYQLSRFSSEG